MPSEASQRIPQLLVGSHQLGILPTGGSVTNRIPWSTVLGGAGGPVDMGKSFPDGFIGFLLHAVILAYAVCACHFF